MLLHKEELLKEYLPAETISDILFFIEKHRITFKITNARKTKLGDYRSPYKNSGHIITINRNLSKFAFLLVCLHEFAHLNVWLKNKHTVLPHGEEWKNEFKRFVDYYINKNIFPPDLSLVLQKHIQNPSSTLVTDKALMQKLQKYNSKAKESDKVFLSDLSYGCFFELSGKTYELLNKLRTRYRCKSINDGRMYLVSANALVRPQNKNIN